MKKAAILWLIAALVFLIVSGVIGDWIFFPHPTDWSFRILSNYAATVILLITSGICWSRFINKPPA